MNIINEKIKALYNDKALFAETIEVPYKNLASKIRTVESKIDYLNKFLSHLGLKLKIVDKNV